MDAKTYAATHQGDWTTTEIETCQNLAQIETQPAPAEPPDQTQTPAA